MIDGFFLSYSGNDFFGVEDTYNDFKFRNFPSLAAKHSEQVFLSHGESYRNFDDHQNYRDFIYGYPDAIATKSLLTLVSESDISPAYSRITEKSIKPIIYHRPFIIWGPMGALSIIRDFGFETFNGPIDETYDLIANSEDRLIHILDEIERLRRSFFHLDNKKVFLGQVHDICAYNQKLLLSGKFMFNLEAEFVTRINFHFDKMCIE